MIFFHTTFCVRMRTWLSTIHFRYMKSKACENVSEKHLESYLMNLLPAQIGGSIYDESLAQIEDHLLICPKCQAAAETHDLLMAAFRMDRAQSGGFSIGVGQAFA